MFDVGSNGENENNTVYPQAKIMSGAKKEKNTMLISWKQTSYVPLHRDWTKQYKVYCTEQKQ